MNKETSAEVASVAGDLANITALELAGLDMDAAEALAALIRHVAASALVQRETGAPKLWRDKDGNLFTGENGTTLLSFDLSMALSRFVKAAQLGAATHAAVKAADLKGQGLTTLSGIAGYCAQHAAESRVSWNDWQALATLAADA